MKFSNKGYGDRNGGENEGFGFEDLLEFSRMCKFSNCTHTSEPSCAVKKAISEGLLTEGKFKNYYREKNEAKHISEQQNLTKAVDYMKQRKLFQKP